MPHRKDLKLKTKILYNQVVHIFSYFIELLKITNLFVLECVILSSIECFQSFRYVRRIAEVNVNDRLPEKKLRS